MASLASELVAANGLSANITVLHSVLEDVTDLPGGKWAVVLWLIVSNTELPNGGSSAGPIDILVSEWVSKPT